jgi:hypothetical protein
MAFESAAHLRSAVSRCYPEKRSSIQPLSELDLPFALAVLGKRVGVPTSGEATKLAVAMLSGVAAQEATSEPLPCGEELTRNFETHAKDWLSFYEGKHPWAPRCHATADGNDMVLSCSAT